MSERYLGDGVYAVVTEFDVTLDLRGQDNFTRIVMEPEVIINLFSMPEVIGLLSQSHRFKAVVERMLPTVSTPFSDDVTEQYQDNPEEL